MYCKLKVHAWRGNYILSLVALRDRGKISQSPPVV